MGGGDGGDGGASARASEDRARKASATRDINKLFGIYSDPIDDGTGPKQSDFTRQISTGDEGSSTVFDQAAYDAALADRNARVAASDSTFHSEADANKAARDAMYSKEGGAVFDLNKNKLDEDLSDSKRKLNFALARTGLFGGSEDIAQHDKQQKVYDKGILDARNLADQKSADFQGQDETARLNIINQIQSGIDSGTALENARKGMEVNAAKAAANTNSQIIGNAFDDAGLMYGLQQQNAGIQAARAKYPASRFGALFNAPSYAGTMGTS